MFIVFGTKSIGMEVKDGIVVKKRCSKCGDYRLLYEYQNQTYFTLFFIPIFRTGSEGSSFLHCIVCNTDYYLDPDDVNTNDRSRLLEYDGRITLVCPSCKITLKVKPFDSEEVKIRCKGCGHVFTVKKNYRGY